MRRRVPALLALALLLGTAPLHAQGPSNPTGARTPGVIRGAGSRTGAGEIHVVGKAMGSQQIHFTEAFKVDDSSNLRAMLSTDMTVGKGSADIGAIASSGDQLIAVPKDVDVSAYALLLVYDTKTKTVLASAILPNSKGQSYNETRDSTTPQSY